MVQTRKPKTTTAPRTRRSFGRLRKRASGRWQASYLHHGQLHYAPATFPSKDSGIAWLDAERKSIDNDNWAPPASRANKATAKALTLREYAERWLAQRPLVSGTHRNYEQALRLHILPALGDRALASITAEDVRAWFTDMGSDQETRRARAYGVLTAIFNTAVDDGLIDRSPARVKGGTAVKQTKRSVVLLEPAELAILADKMPEYLRLSVLLAGWCGLRRGEVFALTRADVAADGSTVRINKAVNAYGSNIVVGPTKTAGSNRMVTVPPHVRPAILAHLQEHVGKPKTALLFTDPERGGHISEGRYRPHFFAARAAIDKDELHFHDLRHFGGTMAAYTGATLREIQARLGHTTVSAAMRYQAVAKSREDEMADRLSALANPVSSNPQKSGN
ncbi:integrase [Mycobacterium asiaticum]|nr:integrase [Mycobacterium asiaticum]